MEERIEAVVCAESQERLIDAFMYLYNSDRSTYQHYLSLQSDYPAGTRIKFWVVYKEMLCIECALWPVLYPFTAWCESALVGDKESILHSFRYKLLCEIISYNNNFELLQYQYDRWIFWTVTGAVNGVKFHHCSPLNSLEDKSFTAGYWRWQHRYLTDACL